MDTLSLTTGHLAAPVDLPVGAPQVPSDEKWRVRLPKEFVRYLTQVGGSDETLFITSMDEATVQIFTKRQWQSAVLQLENSDLDPEAREAIVDTASKNGSLGKLDDQGRITLHAEVREALDLKAKDEYRIKYANGYLEMTTAKYFAERLEKNKQKRAEGLAQAKTQKLFRV